MRPDFRLQTVFNGDSFDPDYGIPPMVMPYAATYGPLGFRSNGTGPPYDVVLLGDSFLDVGESDSSTISEQLASVTGRSVLNLGLGWYGPYQYLEALQRYGLEPGTRVAILFFFSGNDIEDIRQYQQWREGGSYYDFLQPSSLIERFRFALHSSLGLLTPATTDFTDPRSREDKLDHLAAVDVGTDTVPMVFTYWKDSSTVEEALATDEWRALASVLTGYRDVARAQGLTPLVVFVPTKLEVYRDRVLPSSGVEVLRGLPLENAGRNSEALRTVVSELELPLVDLLPLFWERAGEGELLYYPFDTHWTLHARQIAARHLAGVLGSL